MGKTEESDAYQNNDVAESTINISLSTHIRVGGYYRKKSRNIYSSQSALIFETMVTSTFSELLNFSYLIENKK